MMDEKGQMKKRKREKVCFLLQLVLQSSAPSCQRESGALWVCSECCAADLLPEGLSLMLIVHGSRSSRDDVTSDLKQVTRRSAASDGEGCCAADGRAAYSPQI